MGGAACQGFADCCSGVCANQKCEACAATTNACGGSNPPCCNGLSCYNGVCGSCKADNLSCIHASDCCSNICDNGTCAPCTKTGAACSTAVAACCGGNACQQGACCAQTGQNCTQDNDCCSGPGNVCINGKKCGQCLQAPAACTDNHDCCDFNCCNGVCAGSATTLCTTCPANGPTCNTALTVDPTQAKFLCGVPQQDYVAFIACACLPSGACLSACMNDLCTGAPPAAACTSCLTTTGTSGCGDQFAACTSH
jgi:hypothetical protein